MKTEQHKHLDRSLLVGLGLSDEAANLCMDRIETLESEISSLKAKLESADNVVEHARHDEGCCKPFGADYRCRCGFDDAKKAYDQLKEQK